LIQTMLPTLAVSWTRAETTVISWTMGTTSRDRDADLSSPPPVARTVMLNWPRGVPGLVTIVIVEENEGFADAGVNRIPVAAGAPWADRVTGTETPETRVTDNRIELLDP